MSLAVFETFLVFAERAMRSKPNFPDDLDPVELASAFASYGVVLLHSQMEQCVKKAVSLRCAKCADLEVRSFAQSIVDEKTGKFYCKALGLTVDETNGISPLIVV